MNRLEKLKQWFDKRINEGRLKSPWIVHFDCGSCNGCDIETLACLTPVYDVERFGIINVGNPKHADVLLVTGTVNSRNRHVLKNIYDQMPEPKAVIAIGACGMTGGVFRECYNVLGGVDQVIPVDVYVPGCPAKPEAIIDGVVTALERIKVKLGLIEDPALAGGEAAAAKPDGAPAGALEPAPSFAQAEPEKGVESEAAVLTGESSAPGPASEEPASALPDAGTAARDDAPQEAPAEEHAAMSECAPAVESGAAEDAAKSSANGTPDDKTV